MINFILIILIIIIIFFNNFHFFFSIIIIESQLKKTQPSNSSQESEMRNACLICYASPRVRFHLLDIELRVLRTYIFLKFIKKLFYCLISFRKSFLYLVAIKFSARDVIEKLKLETLKIVPFAELKRLENYIGYMNKIFNFYVYL